MSLLSIAPEIVSAASGNLKNLSAALRNATAEAASRTTAFAAPAADEVSEAITALFGTHAQEFQALSAKAASFHEEFVNLLNGGATQYLSTEATNVQQTLADAVNTPAQSLLGHPLVGTGQALAAAVANPAETIYSQSLGPFEAFYDSTSFDIPPVKGISNNLGIRLNTPLGPVELISEGVAVTATNDWALNAYHFSAPFIYFGYSTFNTLATWGSTPASVLFTLNGIELALPLNPLGLPSVSISWLGTPFYDVLPRIGYSPVS
ncbi:hypothetical protein B1987_27710 [Mycobacterium kansasii]|uniref:Putative PE family protein PE23 n=1 Tax=Mycobacterium attenuatum TaxID=2341086 RepID=A0A498Q1K9_9MYCO|nr:PE family protein [Mycobacterium attenuatum]ORB86924.1 hypothetical protein B1987_27710 [Mycobacterium kansasii]VBA38422.1 putative PE family protein PE23 [Mycobacterium attenuatum]